MTLITAEGWGWRYAGRTTWAIRGLDLAIEAGERVLLLGTSGAGKSTLLYALAGVLGGADEGTETGRLLIGGQHPTRLAGQVGLVQQDPQSQVILARVGDDVAFGPENLGVPRAEIWDRVRRGLREAGIGVPLDYPSGELSGGQQQRLALAGVLAMYGVDHARNPAVLLLDEPTANLDPAGVAEVRDAVARVVADRTTTLIVVEHRVEVWQSLIDRVIVLEPGGGLAADGTPGEVFARDGVALAEAGVWVPGIPLPVAPRETTGTVVSPVPLGHGTPILAGVDLAVGYVPGRPVREHLDVRIAAGRSTVITGPNGAGKSTLALTLAGLLPQLDGRVQAAPTLVPSPANRRQRRLADLSDPHTWTSTQLLTRLGCVFQEPGHQFVATSVRDELAVGLRALRWSPADIAARVDELLDLLRLAPLAGANPFTLSGGEKRRLSVGTILASGPQIMILDEPTFGQDRATWIGVVGLIGKLLDEGRTVVSVTHDQEFRRVLGEHHIELGVGRWRP